MTLLVINRSDSLCGACGQGADPREWRHETVLGYFAKDAVRPEGCLSMYTEVRSDYSGMRGRIEQMRPDLKWAGFEDSESRIAS